jgi:small subunit ribosomal protein S8e
MWHSDQNKRKITGGKRKSYRTNRSIEVGGYPTETGLGEPIRRFKKTYGSVKKIKLLQDRYVNLSISRTGKTEKVSIDEVAENTANIDYNRRRVITRGAVIETSLGRAVITSRPGQDGVLNAILLTEK